VIALIFIGQLTVIFWLGQRIPFHPRRRPPGPTIRMAGTASGELLALTDPTLFALPHVHGFSGPAWLNIASPSFQPFVWAEPPRWLTLPVEQLGATLQQVIATNQFKPAEITGQPQPELLMPELASEQRLAEQSLLRVTGQLASRRLLTPLNLPAWTNSFVLSNTLIQVVVNALGEPFPVGPGRETSGDKRADQFALSWAKAARFAPLPGATQDTCARHPLADLTFGELFFQWHTLPLMETNGAAPKP
jgi:hypothetical protein